jgi:hypothetical protein
MSNLAETLRTQSKVIEKFARSAEDLGLNAAVRERWLSSEEFLLMRVPITKLSTNYGEICASGETPRGLIVIDANKNKVGSSAGGFIPPAIVVAGTDIVRFAKNKDACYLNCWVGTKSMKALGLTVHADHMVGTNELNKSLNNLLKAKNSKGYAYIVEIYPFEGYFIYSYDGDQYRQAFSCDNISRKVALEGSPVKVFTQYKTASELTNQVSAGAGAVLGDQEEHTTGYPDYTDIRKRRELADSTHFGPSNSFLNNPQMYEDSDVEDALDVYLHQLKEGIWKPVSSQWAPVPQPYIAITNRMKACAQKYKLKSFIPQDFVSWYKYQIIRAAENVGVNDTANPGSARSDMGAKKTKKKK